MQFWQVETSPFFSIYVRRTKTACNESRSQTFRYTAWLTVIVADGPTFQMSSHKIRFHFVWFCWCWGLDAAAFSEDFNCVVRASTKVSSFLIFFSFSSYSWCISLSSLACRSLHRFALSDCCFLRFSDFSIRRCFKCVGGSVIYGLSFSAVQSFEMAGTLCFIPRHTCETGCNFNLLTFRTTNWETMIQMVSNHSAERNTKSRIN